MKSIKTMGIAVAMALALTAFAGAGTASANYFKAAVEPEAWNGSLTGKNHSLQLGGLTPAWHCKGVAFSGETKAKTISDLKVSPQLKECEHVSGAPTSWQMNGCKFRFKPGPGPSLTGTMDIVDCVEPMRYESWASACYMEIGNQNDLGKVEYLNITVGGVPAVKVIVNLTGITYYRHATACGEGPEGTFSDGAYQGEWTVKGATIPGGTAAAAEIQSATVSSPRFAAEEGPATLSGVNTFIGSLRVMFDLGANGRVYCVEPTFSGTASLVPTEAITVTPKFHECSFEDKAGKEWYAISDKSLTAGGCSYQLYAKGGFDIVGGACAASPITVTITGCVFKVGPQSNASGPTFKNQGSGKSRVVTVWTNPQTGMTYTAEGAGCAKQGTFNEASVKVPGTVFSAKDPSGAAQGFWIE